METSALTGSCGPDSGEQRTSLPENKSREWTRSDAMTDGSVRQDETNLTLALGLAEQALKICDASGYSLAAINLCEAIEKLKALNKQ